MRRIAVRDMHAWFHKKNRLPLILRGARQVGKSTLVRLFCQENHLELIEINLEIKKLRTAQSENFKIDELLDEIQLISNRRITERSLIFLDEIQDQPRLIQLLRYFAEEKPEIAVIAAGSLLEIALREGEFSFPVGRVEFYNLGPMTFYEFLDACSQDLLLENLRARRSTSATHEAACEFLKKYFYVGGMPKAVLSYVESKSLVPAREVHAQLVQAYVADFPKYSNRANLARLSRIFESSALHVGRKVIYQAFDRESKSREIRRSIGMLIDARVLMPCYHSNASAYPLEASKDESVFKLYFVDIGLLNFMHRIDYAALDSEFTGNFSTKGVLAEQFVAQHLAYYAGHSLPPTLNYCLREKGTQKSEIDFLIQTKGEIIPVEVKAASGGKLRSLFYFAKQTKWNHALKFSLQQPSSERIKYKISGQSVEVALKCLPLYSVESLG